jgi:hypothetical protein
VTTFLPDEEPARSAVGRAAALAVARWALATGRVHLSWATVDGAPAARSPFGSYLIGAGFAPAGGGFRLVAGELDEELDDEESPSLRSPRSRTGDGGEGTRRWRTGSGDGT